MPNLLSFIHTEDFAIWKFLNHVWLICSLGFPHSSVGKESNDWSPMQETTVRLLAWEDPLEKDRLPTLVFLGFPCSSVGKESACNVQDLGLIPGFGKSPWRRERLPTPVFWPGEFHGLYNPRGHRESDMTEWLSLHFTSLHYLPSALFLLLSFFTA